jgi:hypothetical protein
MKGIAHYIRVARLNTLLRIGRSFSFGSGMWVIPVYVKLLLS